MDGAIASKTHKKRNPSRSYLSPIRVGGQKKGVEMTQSIPSALLNLKSSMVIHERSKVTLGVFVGNVCFRGEDTRQYIH